MKKLLMPMLNGLLYANILAIKIKVNLKMPDTLLTTSQAADFLMVSPSRIRQLILENRLPATKVGRDQLIKQSDLESFAVLPRQRTGRPPKI